MNFYCVYVKNKKKLDKYIKINNIRNKYIVDVKKIIDEYNIDINDDLSKLTLKSAIYNKISKGMEKNKDIYYIPDFNNTYSLNKLLHIKKLLENNPFNIIIFYNEFKKDTILMDELYENINSFDISNIIKDI